MGAGDGCSRCPRLVLSAALASLVGLAFVGVLAGCGHGNHGNGLSHVENRRTGIAVTLPSGWSLQDDPSNGSSAVMLSTYRLAHLGDMGESPPKGETWLLLFDYGPLSSEPSWSHQIRPLPSLLPPEKGYAEFGTARILNFRSGGHHFTAYVKGDPRPAATLGILRSIRITPVGRSLALVITVHTIDGVQIWRVGNPRSKRRLIVVGCPRRAKSCSGSAVTNRLVRGAAFLAADVWVIERLRGREDILARLQRQLQPEATIRLGSIRDPELWTRRIVALAR